MNWIGPVRGSGVVVKQAYPLAPFDAMKIRSQAGIDIRLADTPSAELEVDDNLAPLVRISVRDRTLHIEDTRSLKPTTFRIRVDATQLNRLATADCAAVHAAGLHGQELTVSAGGSSAVTLTGLHVETLSVDLGNKAVLHASGTAGALSATLGGATALATDELSAECVTLNTGGSSQAAVRATSILKMNLGGSTAIRYFGQPRVELASGGSASVIQMEDEKPQAGM